jgi:hypothetical protein
MTRPRRSTPGIAFAAQRAGRFQPGSDARASGPTERQGFDIVAVGRHAESARRARRAVSVAGGIALVALALSARGIVGGVLVLGGIALFVRGVTGRPLGETAKQVVKMVGSRADDDRVDQASWESFPASDPPAHSPPKR